MTKVAVGIREDAQERTERSKKTFSVSPFQVLMIVLVFKALPKFQGLHFRRDISI